MIECMIPRSKRVNKRLTIRNLGLSPRFSALEAKINRPAPNRKEKMEKNFFSTMIAISWWITPLTPL